MKFYSSLILTVGLLAVACRSGVSEPYAIPIDASVPADSVAAELTATLPLEKVAVSLVYWLGEAEISHNGYARELARSISMHYNTSEQNEFARLVDSIQHTMPKDKQLRALAVGSVPENLAKVLVDEDIDSAAYTEIAEIYRTDSILYRRFTNSLDRERSRHEKK